MSGNEKKTLKVSVRNLVEFSARSGDLFADVPMGPTAKEGIKGHQEIQKQRGKDWQSEFGLKHNISYRGFDIRLQGRVDLININQSPVTIEELKTTYFSANDIPLEKKEIHQAQAKIYAYLYHLSVEKQDLVIDETTRYQVTVSWYNLLSKEVESESSTFVALDLKTHFYQLLDIYLDWYDKYLLAKQQTIETAQRLEFPFDSYRPNQHYFAKAVYQTIKDKKQLIVEAPTGTGKTMSVLFPGCKAVGEKVISQIVYLTAKVSGQKSAIKTLALLKEAGISINYVVLQAKDRACPCRSEDPKVANSCDNGQGQCSRTIGFFDRLPEARLDCLNSKELTVDKIQQIAGKHHLCPFELSLQMVRWSTAVICDFNYFLDPMVKLSAFDESINERAVFVDEYHNLVDRSRNMYSAELSSIDIQAIAKQLPKNSNLKKALSSLNRLFKKLAAEASHTSGDLNQTSLVTALPPESISKKLANLLEIISDESMNSGFAGGLTVNQPSGFHQWLKQVYRYIFISELYNENHQTIILKSATNRASKENINLKLLCLDPADFLKKKFKSARSVIGFSATVSPANFYQLTTGLNEDTAFVRIPSPFDSRHQLTLRCDYIDTRWNRRDQSYQAICDLIFNTFSANPGNYMAYFPSYEYLNQCHSLFKKQYTDLTTLVQERNSDEAARESFLSNFFKNSKPKIGFAILGGVYGEGIDYQGNALTGAIVIGTGMPQPGVEQKLIESKYAESGFNEFQFTYQFPGFTRVKQTAGRVIRSETDKGVVILVDPRFRRRDYQELMPQNWRLIPCKDLDEVNSNLKGFWSSKD